MIFQPSGNRCHTSEKTPPTSPFSRARCQCPSTSAASGPTKRNSSSEKLELPHCRAVRVIPFVSCHHPIPSACNPAAPGKRQLRRMPIAHQKRVDVPAIPCGLLRAQYRPYRCSVGLVPAAWHSRLCPREYPSEHEQSRRRGYQQPASPLFHCQPPLSTPIPMEHKRAPSTLQSPGKAPISQDKSNAFNHL